MDKREIMYLDKETTMRFKTKSGDYYYLIERDGDYELQNIDGDVIASRSLHSKPDAESLIDFLINFTSKEEECECCRPSCKRS